MLVCHVSLRSVRRTLAAEIAEAVTADDAATFGNIIFATLVDDPASVNEIVDAYLGEIMLEAANASDNFDAGLSFDSSVAETITATDVPDATTTAAAASTWNPSDKSATITLTGGNLTAGSTSTADGAVRSTKSVSTGKAYFEITWNTTSIGADGSCGIATPTAVLSSMGNTALGIAVMYRSGSIWVNGTGVGTIVLPAAPFTICVAVDLVNSRIWFRADNGAWNGSGTADPATNTLGMNISALFPANAAFPALTMNAIQSAAFVGNFGASAFAQSIPSGFTAWDLA